MRETIPLYVMILFASLASILGIVVLVVMYFKKPTLPSQTTLRILSMLGLVVASISFLAAILVVPEVRELFSSNAASQAGLEYLIRVEDSTSGQAISNARVSITTTGSTPISTFTDSNGVSRFSVGLEPNGQLALLVVEADGYETLRQNINLQADGSPKVVSLDPFQPVAEVTNTPAPTNTEISSPTPTEVVDIIASPTPTSTPDPVVSSFPVEEVQNILSRAGGTFGVMVYDVANDRLIYAQNRDEVFSAASLIKIPIALTVYYLADEGEFSLDERLVLTEEDKVGGTGSLQFSEAGTSYTIRDLTARMLYESDNTAANMILRRIGGLDRIDDLLPELGLEQTQVQRFLMDFEALQAGRDNVTSPSDVMHMLRDITQGEFTGSQELLDSMGQTVYQQKIPALLPNGTVIANKTGVLPAPDGVEHDVALIEMSNGHLYIIVMMSQDLSNNQVAINAIAEASRLIYDYLQTINET